MTDPPEMSGSQDGEPGLHAWGADRSRIFQAARDQYVAERDLHVHYEDGVRRTRRTVRSAPDGGQCPYPGLAAFGTEQARWFFGRDRPTAQLLIQVDRRLFTGGPLVVSAPSGAGKSSLLRAGLLPAIRRGALPVAGSADWPQVLITPTAQPMAALAAGLEESAGLSLREAEAAASSAAGSTRLRAALSGAGTGEGRLVVVVDQLEELFTLGAGEREQYAFLDLLAALAEVGPGGQGPDAVVVYGLRSDFYTPCAGFPQLRDALRHGQLLLGPMTRDELREAIRFPARDVGLEVEPGLVELLLRDLGADAYGADAAESAALQGDPEEETDRPESTGATGTTELSDASEAGAYEIGRLPYLAHALRATWQQRHGHTLTVDGYRATGGIHQAIATTAEQLFGSLDTEEQQAARTLFLRLVRVGEGTQDTRRRLPRTALEDIGADPGTVTAVVDAYTRGRLLTQRQDTVEIAHEALLRAWPRLRRWIDADRTGLLIRQQLEQAAADWAGADRDPGLLYRGIRLQAARDWADRSGNADRPSPAAAAFLTASTRGARRSARARHMVIAGLTALVVITSAAAVVALQQRSTAQDQQRVATVRQLLAQADAALETDPRTALRLGIAAHRLHPDAETYAALERTLTTTAYTGRLIGLNSEVNSVAYAPGGRYLAAAFAQGGVMIWDVQDPMRPHQLGERLTIPGADGASAVAFSADDRRLVAADHGGAAAIWDLADPRHPRRTGAVPAADSERKTNAWLSPDGTVLVRSSEAAPGLQLWDLTDPARPHPSGAPVDDRAAPVERVAFSRDGTVMATAARNTKEHPVTLWNIRRRQAPRPLGRLAPALPDSVFSLALSADGRTLALSGAISGISMWNVGDPARPRPAGDFTRFLLDGRAVFAPRGATLATIGSRDTGLQLWDVRDIDRPYRIDRLTAGRDDSAMAFAPDGRGAASGSGDGVITLWNLERAGHPRAFGPPFVHSAGNSPTGSGFRFIDTLALSADGTMLATGARDGDVALWETTDPARPRRLAALTGHTGREVRAVAFAPDGRTLATADFEGTVVLWDLTDRARPRRLAPSFTGSASGLTSLVFSADGRTLVVSGSGGATFWDLRDTGRPRRRAKALGQWSVLNVWRVRDGRVLALVAGSGARSATRSPLPEPTVVVSDSEGVFLQAASEDPSATDPFSDSSATDMFGDPGDPNGARLWDVTDPSHPRQLGQALLGHEQAVGGAVMSPAGDLLVTSDLKGTAILWDLKEPTHARRLGDPLTPPAGDHVLAMALTPSADIMATAGADGNVLLWDLGDRARPRQLGTALAKNLDGAQEVAFSTDGKLLATAGSRGDVVLWDLRPTHDLRDHLDRTACLVADGGLEPDEWARYLSSPGYRNTCPD
ncbi:NACHT and WD repeat domain-containing protein [Streptomyces sp. TLI_105]|uniref:NACHT and WD repeat domain-containing protein n=1 Tax=Streptomyces sp. TLI_105 TaxID=1881019 RepID=UPI00089AF199|nr:AAA family ATPase [Streptomyces sp. TLI_105]SEB60503.1 WD40 repeat [Streptomyces sp. TLI_105]